MLMIHTHFFFITYYKTTTYLFHLVYSEGFNVAELTELSLGAQKLVLNIWTHVGQKFSQIIHRRHGELWEGQLQQTVWMDRKG